MKIILTTTFYLAFVGLLYLSSFYFYTYEWLKFSFVNIFILFFVTFLVIKYSNSIKLNKIATLIVVVAIYTTIYVKGNISKFVAVLSQVCWLYSLQIFILMLATSFLFAYKMKES